MMWGESRLWVLPIARPDARLLQNSREQRRTDLSAVSVGNGQPVLASRHVEMLSASYRTLKPNFRRRLISSPCAMGDILAIRLPRHRPP